MKNKRRNHSAAFKAEIALEAEYNHLTISITRKGNIILYGSLHKFWTNGRNDNDFHLDQVFESLVKMELELKIDLSKCEVQNIELSVNLYELPTSTGNIISGLLETKLQRSKYGLKQFEKLIATKKHLDSKEAFLLFQSYAHLVVPTQRPLGSLTVQQLVRAVDRLRVVPQA
jgi:hypothetical protein